MAFSAQTLTFFKKNRDGRELAQGVGSEVYFEHNLLVSIGQQQQRHLQHRVVAAGLVADLLGEGHVGAFALHDHPRTAVGGVDHDVAAAGHTVDGDGALHLHQLQWITKVPVQHEDGVLAHSLLGRERHPSAPRGVEHLAAAIGLLAEGKVSIWSFRRHLRRRPSAAGAA